MPKIFTYIRKNENNLKYTQEQVESVEKYVNKHNINVYKNIPQYRQRVMELNRAISILIDSRFKISLADYADSTLTPLKSGDLLASARNYSENPFYSFFKTCLADEISSYYVDNGGILSSFNLQSNSSDYIGISLCYLSQALTAFALAGWIRAQ